MRGVTGKLTVHCAGLPISTRTPHAGSDPNMKAADSPIVIFQPALPMRGVTVKNEGIDPGSLFQPALPMRGVTCGGAG